MSLDKKDTSNNILQAERNLRRAQKLLGLYEYRAMEAIDGRRGSKKIPSPYSSTTRH